jgi:predicted RNase H-like nuclease (RuvC/YqgF family)
MQLAQVEITELDSKVKTLEAENKKMKSVLKDWERAVKGMIQEREREKMDSQQQRHVLQTAVQKSQLECEAVKNEMEQQTIKYKQLRLDYSDLKEVYMIDVRLMKL